MNQELKRIKSKDFSQIDEKLYEDLSRADNLTSTLSQLSDFQKFLMEQITNLNQDPKNNTSRLIAKSIAKNFDHLKESLVKCSRIKEKCGKSKIATLKDQLIALKQELKQTKNTINKQTKQAGLKNSEIVDAFMQNVLAKLEGQKKKNDLLAQKYQSILYQNQQLKQENQKLKKIRTLENKIEAQIIPPKIYTEFNYQTPLKQTNFMQRANSNFVSKDQGWKMTRNQISDGLQNDLIEKRSNSLKRQTSNHELSRKSHINCIRDKQNECLALKSKGVTFEELKRGKSKQKIKLFSMI